MTRTRRKSMRRRRLPKPTRLIAGLLTSLLFAILALPLTAQSAPDTRASYDITKEVTLAGTVSRVYAKPADGMTFGSHLMLETASGQLDASLGKWALQGKGGLSVAAGQAIEVTGVMKTIKEKQVFVVRTVKLTATPLRFATNTASPCHRSRVSAPPERPRGLSSTEVPDENHVLQIDSSS